MSTPPSQFRVQSPPQPPLVSLVLQSKKALQHGEQLCTRAQSVSNHSARTAVGVLALDAKVHWVVEAVRGQLELALWVAKSIEEKRAQLVKQVQAWDTLRGKHSDALDTILEALGAQLIPPDFHQMTSDDESSLFGSQHSDEEEDEDRPANGHVSHIRPSTLRIGEKGPGKSKGKGKAKGRRIQMADRKRWKTLRDFVDDQAIEDIQEKIENDRTTLDDIMSKTDDYPETLRNTIYSLRASLPDASRCFVMPRTDTRVQDVASSDIYSSTAFVTEALAAQDRSSATMAAHLESLVAHYDQMAGALKDIEAGEVFTEEDMHAMNRDTNELPSIMTELEENVLAIDLQQERLQSTQETLQKHLNLLGHTLDDLDELGDIMGEMLQMQESVEVKCEGELDSLHQHLLTFEHLHDRFVLYQTAFSKLILELARRRQYREAAENIVRGMMAQLEAMTEEENQVRSHFNAEYGAHLPEDICLCVGTAPTKWEVVPWNGDTVEFLPLIEDDLLTEARERVNAADQDGVGVVGPDSL